jgi:hypothetical protein
MTLCQLIKAIDDFNGKFGIGGVSDIFFLYGGIHYTSLMCMSLPKAKTTSNTSMVIKSQSSQPKTQTSLLA